MILKPAEIISLACRLLLTIFAFQALNLSASPVVKRSSSGICHPVHSAWYNRTTTFKAFDSVSACLNSGGRLPRGISAAQASTLRASVTAPPAEHGKYKRSEFGHGWDDSDGDCQNSRAEALTATSTTSVRFADAKRCRVVTGRWISPFTGKVIQNAGDTDIDHVVPLAWSWDRGAGQWSRGKREKFANDPVNLWPVEASLNRSKGAKGPDDWLPPAGQCGYVARFFRIVKMYQLTPTTEETNWVRSFLANCRD